ncbi:hypothetical protein [Amycolatopsis magusensis]|uniref:hypothetical protein n=1 Tax=Amycolatopsis magusensis TaxID=882444 RepID=UPI0037A8B483
MYGIETGMPRGRFTNDPVVDAALTVWLADIDEEPTGPELEPVALLAEWHRRRTPQPVPTVPEADTEIVADTMSPAWTPDSLWAAPYEQFTPGRHRPPSPPAWIPDDLWEAPYEQSTPDRHRPSSPPTAACCSVHQLASAAGDGPRSADTFVDARAA